MTLLLLLLAGCVEVGSAPPPSAPTPTEPPRMAILSPNERETVDAAATADLDVALEVEVEGLTLRPPGTCAASDAPCGWIQIKVDGTSCAGEGGELNGRAWGNPVLARMALCPEAAGEHRIELQLADAQGAPIEGTEVGVEIVVEEPSLLARLGGEEGLQSTVTDWLHLHLLPDRNAHGWLYDDRVDLDRIAACASEQLAEFSGSGVDYGTSPLGCLALAEVFAGRGLAAVDFDDALAHLRDALLYHGVDEQTADALVDAADVGLRDVLVEDPTDAAALYHRLGRYAGVFTVVEDFAGRLIADPAVGPFFARANSPPDYPARTAVCISRLVCSAAGGPCAYGHGREPELEGVPCLSMAASHEHLRAPQDDPDGPAIARGHFDVVVGHLVQTLTDFGVPPEDIDLVGAALSPTCADVVQVDPEACGG